MSARGLAAAALTCAAAGARDRAMPLVTVDVDVETLAPNECLPERDPEQIPQCRRGDGDVIVFDPGCGNRDLDGDEPVSTLSLDPTDVAALGAFAALLALLRRTRRA